MVYSLSPKTPFAILKTGLDEIIEKNNKYSQSVVSTKKKMEIMAELFYAHQSMHISSNFGHDESHTSCYAHALEATELLSTGSVEFRM